MPIPITNAATGLLSDELACRNITQKKFAERCQISVSYVSDILNNRRRITTEIALKIERVLGIRASLLLNLQQKYELELAKDKLQADIQLLQPL